ncbi:MAG: nickel pincer cofactor biosynthesis protein LarB, partial [Candidatus Andersenbacteria bacterium]|nr:nickel pincer cofactor biosynthesis protein LarB [Candidatus Andersenbacteria bacterium]
REKRCGLPEVIYCESKTAEQIIEVVRVLRERVGIAFGTRCSPEKSATVCKEFPEADYDPLSRTIRVGDRVENWTEIRTGIIAAGTSDLPVAEEAARTLETFGAPVQRVTDVGVAGIHRLLAHQKTLDEVGVLIVVAGMEGALPSVVGGITRQPLIAVPTSVGYGTALNGFTPLLGMLTSCASGITVVNIDNGFGAAAAAMRILKAIVESAAKK